MILIQTANLSAAMLPRVRSYLHFRRYLWLQCRGEFRERQDWKWQSRVEAMAVVQAGVFGSLDLSDVRRNGAKWMA